MSKYEIGGETLTEVAAQFAELVAARGRLFITTNKGNASKRYGKWAPTKDAEGGRAPSITFELPEFTVNKLQPESAHITVVFSNLQTAINAGKFREQKAATITARLQRDMEEARRMGIKVPGFAAADPENSTEVEQDNSAGTEVVEGEE